MIDSQLQKLIDREAIRDVTVRWSRLEPAFAAVRIVSTYFSVDTLDELIKRNLSQVYTPPFFS